ncbi:MAG: YihY/virulence factor BrkB family protein [Sphingobium sp.]
MVGRSPQSPEARRKRGIRARAGEQGWAVYGKEIAKRVAMGVYNDGFIHAGNLAYMSLVALFPFFIVAASIASIFGRTQDGLEAVNGFLLAVPRNVAIVLRDPIVGVLTARSTSGLLWLGALVGLWTTGSLIETIRDILRRAYGTTSSYPFWHYRLRSVGVIVLSVFATMFAFSMQVALTGVNEFLYRILPFADSAIQIVAATRLVPMAVVTLALWVLFLSLTPDQYAGPHYPKWPGAVLTAVWWYGTLNLLPVVLAHVSGYDLTYGSLAGVMITLIFFFLVGLGVVIGAELNAAFAEVPDDAAPANGQKHEGNIV